VKRYSSRTRSDASLICAVAASSPAAAISYPCTGMWLGLNAQAVDLAALAEHAVWDLSVYVGHSSAEAESLLRCGWSPR